MKQLLTFILLIAFYASHAQSAPEPAVMKEVTVLNDNVHRKIDVQFNADQEIANLLILITDKTGRTVFLDNQYRFKGDYKKTIDLAQPGAGTYSLKVIRDKNIYNKQVQIR